MGDILPADLVILYQDAFFHFDTDRDGVICTKQLGPLLRYCGENPSEADIQDMMNEVDSDASNNLIFPAFLTLMAKRYSDSNAEDEIREAFRVFDSILDEAHPDFSYRSLGSLYFTTSMSLGKNWNFTKHWNDGNGFINRSELRAVMMNLGEKLSEDEIESLIDTVDIDGDGQINYEEFYIMMDPG